MCNQVLVCFVCLRGGSGREKSIHVFPGPWEVRTGCNFFLLIFGLGEQKRREMLQHKAQAAGLGRKSIVFVAFGAGFLVLARVGKDAGRLGVPRDGINFIFERDTDTKKLYSVFFVWFAPGGIHVPNIDLPAGGRSRAEAVHSYSPI